MIGVPELVVILLILVVLFGASRLPKLARSLAEARRELTADVTEAEGSD